MCLRPLLIDLSTRKIADFKVPKGETLNRWLNKNRKNFNLVSCGSCVECLKSKCAVYTSKLLAESLLHSETTGYFVTLTYDEAHLPNFASLDTSVVTRFNDYIRVHVCKPRRVDGKLKRPSIDDFIRYFAIGEYGTLHDRPHYHFVLWSELLSQNELLQIFHSFWTDESGVLLGKIDFQMFASDGAVGYVSKYHTKRIANIMKGSKDDVTSLAYKLSNSLCSPPFIRCSKNLGLDFFLKPEIRSIYLDERQYSYHGFNLLLPPAYREKVLGRSFCKLKTLEYEQKQIDNYYSVLSAGISEDEDYKSYLYRIAFSEKMALRDFINKNKSKL